MRLSGVHLIKNNTFFQRICPKVEVTADLTYLSTRGKAVSASATTSYDRMKKLLLLLALFLIPSFAFAQVTTTLIAPTLSASTSTSANITLTWTDPNSTERRFVIERSTATTVFSTIARVEANVTTYQDSGLLPSTTYSYRIRAQGSRSEYSPYSNIVSATTFKGDTTAPTVSISNPFDTAYTTAQTVVITAAASDNTGVTKVEFYDNGILAATDTTSPYSYDWSISSLNNGTHTWTASAYDAAGNVGTSATSTILFNIAEYVNFKFDETTGSSFESQEFDPSKFPPIILKTLNGQPPQLWQSTGKLTISATGNPSERIYGDPVIDNMMRLDSLEDGTNGIYKAIFFATKIKRNLSNTPLNNSSERIFQYGDQGSSPGQDGGWVARINYSKVPSIAFPSKSISFAIHTPDIGVTKEGGQSVENFPDPIATTRPYADAEWEAGLSILFAVDNSITPYAVKIFINGDLVEMDEQYDLRWPLPGISNNGTGTATSSNGMVFFAQSTDEGKAPLKDADLDYIWIGRAIDSNHLVDIARNLHLEISPY